MSPKLWKISLFIAKNDAKIGDKCHWSWFLMFEVSKILENENCVTFSNSR